MSDVQVASGRVCTACGEWKDADSFGKHAAYAGGLRSRCDECRGRKTERAERMRERLLLAEQGLRRCGGPCGLVKIVSEFGRRAKYADGLAPMCLECDRAASRAFHDAHRDEENAKALERYRDTDPEIIRRRGRVAASRRRARIRDAFVEDVDPQVIFERDEGVCGLCDGWVERACFDVDHIVPLAEGGEHSYANTRLAHVHCNRSRGRSVAARVAKGDR